MTPKVLLILKKTAFAYVNFSKKLSEKIVSKLDSERKIRF